MQRLRREGHLQGDGLDTAHQQRKRLNTGWREIEPLERVRRRAVRLLRLHRLRAADALQLASALTAAMEEPASVELVCDDSRLAAAARSEGFSVR